MALCIAPWPAALSENCASAARPCSTELDRSTLETATLLQQQPHQKRDAHWMEAAQTKAIDAVCTVRYGVATPWGQLYSNNTDADARERRCAKVLRGPPDGFIHQQCGLERHSAHCSQLASLLHLHWSSSPTSSLEVPLPSACLPMKLS